MSFKDLILNKISFIILKGVNIIIFFSLLITASYMLWIKEIQWSFDLYVLLALYMIFTKLEKIS